MKIDNLILWLQAIKKTSEKMGTDVDVFIADEKLAAQGCGFKLTGVREEISSGAFTTDENDIAAHSAILTYKNTASNLFTKDKSK